MDVTKLIQLKPEEEVIMVVHGSLIPLWSKIVLAFLWLTMPFFLLFPLFSLHLFGIVLFFVLLGSGLFYSYRAFLSWYQSVFIVTDRRIIDVDRRGIFSRVVSEATFAQIQDASYHIKGIWPTLLRYGNIVIRIVGNGIELEVFNVRHPAKVHDLINDLRNTHVEGNVVHP